MFRAHALRAATLGFVLSALAAPARADAAVFGIDVDEHPGRYGQALAVIVLSLGAGVLLTIHTKRRVAATPFTGNDDVEYQKGWLVPPDVKQTDGTAAPTEDKRLSALRAMYLGKDNRASTSKTVALAWTVAIVYGLLALMFADFMGDSDPWEELTEAGLQEDYLLLLGGPFAAAVIAKYKNVATEGAETKTTEPSTGSGPLDRAGKDLKFLVTDDTGAGDLGDLQYVMFNFVALIFFFGTFIPDLSGGFPDMPALLVGLALTSAGTYAAKQAAIRASGPRLLKVFPETVPKIETVEVFGNNLISDGQEPLVSVDGLKVDPKNVRVNASGSGVQRLTFALPAAVTVGDQHQVRIITVGGVTALTDDGIDYLPLKVTPANTLPKSQSRRPAFRSRRPPPSDGA